VSSSGGSAACAHLAVLSLSREVAVLSLSREVAVLSLSRRTIAVPWEVLSLVRQTRDLLLNGMVVVTLILNETDVKSTSPLFREKKRIAKMTKV
jgi:hypothetical protein